MKLFQIVKWIQKKFHQGKERTEENQSGKLAPEKNQEKEKRKSLDLDSYK